ncbi:MAG: hypothetical protein J2P43_07770 [Candidatus Dormibacteraeota bacterium]|nr:hypothetical protein [Candidatus Dormibacteraeota bacterium]
MQDLTGDRLERALGSWAATRGVGRRDRERIRTAILLTPEVDALWWDQFNEQMARLATRAQMPFGSEPHAQVPGRGQNARIAWGAAPEPPYA